MYHLEGYLYLFTYPVLLGVDEMSNTTEFCSMLLHGLTLSESDGDLEVML